ncbi:hypothetical protein P153DRAFT_428765 [Dothidotthia symphoricarpi CBS 119687]|uniref:Uncharacterized protein n=1 Tax=Dothidotthia symphoricarpi CBS 119687 TaxID=1392245 RepID=A0A6A6AL51_9PLEO|nr:uncharacterized protein P153DRAFT_428765 [Dothidotthia symphoricarpi CBS 119687]KAF2132702.1 hypothetical protein P153DRAFT_428765 [Dothidotthia symphoricarpi CBS 119687]
MSQQGSPRKSNPGRSTTESDRMPFAAAEALLWGKEIKRNLEFIVPQMKELQRQHEAYDARIQAAEITAEAAEAATARVQRIEQKLVAMEEDDTDRPFDKWVGEEITQLKMFADRNKDVRTKLTELENRFLNATDSLDTARDMSKDLRSVFRHLDDLEIDRRGQSNRIKAMEKEILDLRMLCHGYAARDKELQRVVGRPDTLSKTIVWPREVQLHDNRSRRSSRASPRSKKAASQKRRMTAESETEDEDLNSPGRGRIQVPRSSSITSNSDAVLVSSSPSKDLRYTMPVYLEQANRNKSERAHFSRNHALMSTNFFPKHN